MNLPAPSTSASLVGAPEVVVTSGELRAHIRADAHLQVCSLRHRGTELLVGPGQLPPDMVVHGHAAGITLLHPWANRLASDRFEIGAVPVDVSRDPAVGRDPGGLAIHGLDAPPGAWQLQEAAPARAVARLTHPGAVGSAFPFAHALRVDLVVAGSRLTVSTLLRNTSPHPMPAAFGWHPYLRMPDVPRAAWQLELPPRRHLQLDESGIPTPLSNAQPATRLMLADLDLDEAYGGLRPGDWVAVSGGGRRVTFSLLHGYTAAQLFAPAAHDVVSVEPMASETNAMVTGRGLRTLQPGEALSAIFALDVADYSEVR